MKLTNLTLAVLVAVGVAACGGSDDNNSNNPTDKGNTNNRTTPTPTPKPDANNNQAQVQKPEDPRRAAPGNTVEDALKGDVAVAKTTYAEAGTRDLLTGYAPNIGVVSDDKDPLIGGPNGVNTKEYIANSTDAQNIKRLSSRINYSATGQFRANAHFAHPEYNGAVLANPNFTYALGKDNKWYRMQPVADNGTTVIDWDKTKPETKYKPLDPNNNAQFPANGVSQDKLFFIPNVKVDGTKVTNIGNLPIDTSLAHGGHDAIVNDDAAVDDATDFNVGRNEVQFRSAVFNGRTYDLSRAGAIQKVDLNTVPVDTSKVQTLPVTLNYSVLDNKSTSGLNDDNLQLLTAKAGAMKAYNLPYSLAFVTVNQKGAENARYTDGAHARNLFDYPKTQLYNTSGATTDKLDGSYKVVGLQTQFLPRNGRADYNGKSFGPDSIGDIHLRADFGETGSHINGTIANRTYADGRGALPEITLNNIQLSTPGNLNTTGTKAMGNMANAGTATARNANGTWDVQLYGPNAEEAGGLVHINNDQIIPGGTEVFTSQRGEMIQHSNISNQ